MALLPSLRNLISSFLRPTPPLLPPPIALLLPKSLSFLSPKTPIKPHATNPTGPKTQVPLFFFFLFHFPHSFPHHFLIPFLLNFVAEKTLLLLKKDERVVSPGISSHEAERVQNTTSASTIAAIVTSLGGPPGAVGIVRLSGPSAVAIVARVFRPATIKNKKNSWRPISHVVEYGVVLDPHGNVLDEVLLLLLLFSN